MEDASPPFWYQIGNTGNHQLACMFRSVFVPNLHQEMVLRGALKHDQVASALTSSSYLGKPAEALPSDLRWQREALLRIARRSLVGCDEDAWLAAAPAACALAVTLEGVNLTADHESSPACTCLRTQRALSE